MTDSAEIKVASNSTEMMLTARVISDLEGKPQSVILNGVGVEIKVPGPVFPFVDNGAMVLCILSIVQVKVAEPELKPKLLIPGKMN